MSPVKRAIGVLTKSRPTLAASAQEPATTASLFTGYALLIAALPAIGSLLALLLFAGSALGYILVQSLILLLLMYALREIGVTFLTGLVAGALAPRLGGQDNAVGAMKLVVYAATAIFVAGFLAAVLGPAVPELSLLLRLAGFGFAGYLLYVGSGPLLGVPQNQAAIFAGVLTVIWFILYLIAEWIIMRLFVSMLFTSAMGSGFGA
jgi:hypothetical protein